jgi:hypothetical protein
MKHLPNLNYLKLTNAAEKPVGKYANLRNYIMETTGVNIDDMTLDKKLRTFFEDLITEILKNPADWNRTRNINFMELFKYLQEPLNEPNAPSPQISNLSNWQKDYKEMTRPRERIHSDMGKIAPGEETKKEGSAYIENVKGQIAEIIRVFGGWEDAIEAIAEYKKGNYRTAALYAGVEAKTLMLVTLASTLLNVPTAEVLSDPRKYMYKTWQAM